MMASIPDDRREFELTVRTLEADVTMAGSTAVWEAGVRSAYQHRTALYVADLRRRAISGQIGWAEAAIDANRTRNAAMELMRTRSTPVGRALAEWIKGEGKTLNELIARYAVKRHGANVVFDRLSAAERDAVFADVVAAAGRANANVSRWVLRASHAGRGLLILSLGISIYTIATSPDPAATARREGAVTLGGIAGGIGGGALAGLACGPGAPICVTVGAFAGGALAAFGIQYFW